MLKDVELYSGLEGHQPLVYAVIQIALLSLQCFHDFQTKKLVFNDYLILHKLHEHVGFFENNITSLQDKPTYVNVFALSLTI